MKTIDRSLVPIDFSYYRTGSRLWFDYYRKYTDLIIHRIGSGYEFLRAGKIIGNIYTVFAEKIDVEPTREMLIKLGIKHGIIFWGPLRRRDKPVGWFRLPTLFAKRNLHSSRSAFSILDREDYWNKWKPSARAHRRKILQLRESGVLRIEEITDMDVYLDIYKKTRVLNPFKSYLVRWSEKIRDLETANIRIFIAYIQDQPLAGAIFIDECVTSEYFTSFYHKDSHPYHLGIALMDHWFHTSYDKGIKYCDLDHMYDPGQYSIGNVKGYTLFKESIADHDVYFHDVWVKIF